MKKAFTIIELLVAIAIIGILIGVVLVALNSAKDRARYSKALVDMQTIAAAASNYQAEKDVWPDDTNPGVMPHELRSQNFRGSLPISTTLPTPPCANMVYDWDNWCASGVPSCNDHTNVTRRVTLRFSDTYLQRSFLVRGQF